MTSLHYPRVQSGLFQHQHHKHVGPMVGLPDCNRQLGPAYRAHPNLRPASTFTRRQAIKVHAAERSMSPVMQGVDGYLPKAFDCSKYPSLEGKNILVTGSARGIGFCTARLLARLGGTVYLADVDEKGLSEAVQSITAQVPGARVVATPRLDLGSQSAVHAWADAWLSGSITSTPGMPALHVLINNAGANFMGIDPWYTDQGVAGLPQVNYVGPYTLTRHILPSLLAAGTEGRVVNVASLMHRFSELPEDPDFFLRDWWTGGSYRNCKHANVVFTLLMQQAVDKELAQSTAKLTCVAVDPGAVYSNIWANSKVFGRPPGSTIIKALFATPDDACATSVHAAAGTDVQGGQYWARGLFAKSVITRNSVQPLAGALSCMDWPVRNLTNRLADCRPVNIADEALDAVTDGRGVALWDAAADLAGLPRWHQGLLPK